MSSSTMLDIGSATHLLKWGLLGLVATGLYMFTSFLYAGYRARSRIWRLQAQGVPTIPHTFLLGHIAAVGAFKKAYPNDANFLYLQRWIYNERATLFPGLPDADFPPIVYLDMWPIRKDSLAYVYDVDMARQLTQTTALERSGFQTRLFKPLTENSDLFSLEGPEWKVWRQRFSPAFSPKSVTALVPEIIEEVEIFVQGLEDKVGKDGGWGEVFPFADRAMRLTLDVIIRAMLDTRLHEQTIPDRSAVRRGIADILKFGLLMNLKFPFASKQIDLFKPNYKKMIADLTTDFDAFIDPPVHKIMADGASNNTKGATGANKKSIVKLAWDAVSAEKVPDKMPRAQGSDMEFLKFMRSNIKIFLFAGYDTTATTIAWMAKLLADHPAWLAKLREEHDTVIGTDISNIGAILRESPHLLNQLPLTTAVIKETLRLKAPASTNRQGKPGVYLSPAGSNVRYPTEGFAVDDGVHWLHIDPDVWFRAKDFLPERWLVDKDHELHPVPGAWRPFGIGTRACLGQELSMIEMRMVAVMVLRRFDIEEAWDKWDATRPHDAPKDTVDGERLYSVGIGPAHIKDDMPVHVRLRQT